MTKKSYKFSYFPDDVMLKYRKLRATYGERDSDIYVSTYTRSGTTWVQTFLYQLTTDGNMDFDHIFDVSPWLYYSALRRVEPSYPPEPRILKTHDDYNFYSDKPKGRFIYVIRDGKDIIVSFYHHRINVRGYEGTFEEHFNEFINNNNYNWFEHVKGWVENKNHFPILYVKYESLKNDFENEIKRIIDFCGISINDSILKRTKERSSFSFMKKHAPQFGPKSNHFELTAKSKYIVRDPYIFIRNGLIGEGNMKLNNEQKNIFNKKFNETLGHLELVSEYGG